MKMNKCNVTHSLSLTVQCANSVTHLLNHTLSLTHPSIPTHLTTLSQSLTNLLCLLQCNPGRTRAARCHRPQPSPSPQQQRATAALRVTNPTTFTFRHSADALIQSDAQGHSPQGKEGEVPCPRTHIWQGRESKQLPFDY